VTLLRRPAPRFFVWAALLVGIAAVAGTAGLPPWMIAVVEFAAWLLVAACERALTGPWAGPVERGAVTQPPPPPEPVSAPTVEPLPVDLPVPVEPEPEPVAVAPSPPQPHEQAQESPARPSLPVMAQLPPATGDSTRWNVWRLEQVVQERAPENEELEFLIVYLRDFADADGLLPPGFDALVRESFGDLLPRAE